MTPTRLAAVVAALLACTAPAGAQVFGDAAPLNTSAPTDAGADGNPRLATDGAGTWLAVWSTAENLAGNGTDRDIAVARSTDGGVTWSAAALVNGNAVGDTGADTVPVIATDGTAWVVVWVSTDTLGGTVGTDPDLLVSRSTDAGLTWSAPAALNGDAAGDTLSDLTPAITTDGAAWVVVWAQGQLIGGDFDVKRSTSTDDGATWSPPAYLNAGAGADTGDDVQPTVAADGSGRFRAVWVTDENVGGTLGTDGDLMLSRSDDGGITWTPPVPLAPDAQSDTAGDAQPSLATDGAGTWVAVWSRTPSGLGADGDVVASRSADDGVTWTSPTTVNDDAGGDTGDDQFPSLVTDGRGAWVVGWARSESLSDVDVLVARSYDGGATWTASPEELGRKPAGDGGIDVGPVVVTDRRGTFVAAWSSTDPLGGTIGSDTDVLYALAVGADHYDCYQARPAPGAARFAPVNLTLEDQFGLVPSSRLEKPRSVCAPAIKNAEPVIDATAHLTCYTMKDNVQPRFTPVDVAVWNQFGAQRLKVRKPWQLCVPSEKNGVASALGIDHYRCYKAKFADRETFGPRTVTLADQFQTKDFDVRPCVRFCTPVSVNGDEIRAPAAHLTCYKLTPAAGAPPPFDPAPVTVENDLGTLDLTVRPLVDLCVPSLKTVLP